MLSSLCLLVILSFSPFVAGNLVNDIGFNYDRSLEGLVEVYEREVEVIEKLSIPSKWRKPKSSDGLEGINARSLLNAREEALVDALEERQSCNAGYWYCASFGRCCPRTTNCCSAGYCIEPNDVCCPKGPCNPGEGCCGSSHCYPLGGQCCSDESFCTPGNKCYIHPTQGRVCCTDEKCTAHVDDNGSTRYATTTTTTQPVTTTLTQTYTWTVTYWYWYYYWTVSVQIDASIVTSTRRTTTTWFVVATTDAAAASEYFSNLSKTVVLSTPAEATSLETLAGRTSFAKAPPSSTSSQPRETETSSESSPDPTSRATTSSSSESSGSSESSELSETETSSIEDETSRTESSTPESSSTQAETTSSSASPTGGSSAAHALYSNMDAFTVWFLTFGAGVGLVAMML
ncbi:hypothetical protein V2G26_017164 [Clonostachys chloroleuca]